MLCRIFISDVFSAAAEAQLLSAAAVLLQLLSVFTLPLYRVILANWSVLSLWSIPNHRCVHRSCSVWSMTLFTVPDSLLDSFHVVTEPALPWSPNPKGELLAPLRIVASDIFSGEVMGLSLQDVLKKLRSSGPRLPHCLRDARRSPASAQMIRPWIFTYLGQNLPAQNAIPAAKLMQPSSGCWTSCCHFESLLEDIESAHSDKSHMNFPADLSS